MFRFFKVLSMAIITATMVVLATVAPMIAQTPTNSIPTTTLELNGLSVNVPDWTKITFNTLPPFLKGGSIAVASDVMGYDVSRTWNAGDSAASIIGLGDVADAFGLEKWTLNDIAKLTGHDILPVPLGDISLMSWQNVNTLVKAIPGLANLSLSLVPPLEELFGSAFGTVAAAISNNPLLANTPLGEVLDLSKFSVSTIPGLEEVPLAEFANWQKTAIAGIPFLADVPFSEFPTPIPTNLSAIALADVVFGEKELADPTAISNLLYLSGTMEPRSGAVTIPVPPQPGDATRYVELADLEGSKGAKHGKRWVAGDDQPVPGGYGFLADKEPTGLAVYPRLFKVVLLDTHEAEGTADFAIYFRFCLHLPLVDACSPYAIGPIPWIPVRETEPVILGVQP